jgi:hypothetical protein
VVDEDESMAGIPPENALLNLAIEGWRFGKLFARMLSRMEVTEANRYSNQLRYFLKQVDENLASAGMKLVSIEGQPFDPGIAASALNIADFGPDDHLVVEQMVEPIVMGPNGLIRPGTILLAKLDQTI